MMLNDLNNYAWQDAYEWFIQTCAAQRWAETMTQRRPYSDIQAVLDAADDEWKKMGSDDFHEAFTAHPMIGDIGSLRAKFANTRSLAAKEQSGASQASEKTLKALKDANERYRDKHGFIFIICASGLSADEMLSALNDRLPNSTQQEIRIAAAEQLQITCLRICKGLESTQGEKE